MIDYELDDFENDRFGEFEIFVAENYDEKYTSLQLLDMFTSNTASIVVLDVDDYDSDIPY